MRKSNYDKTPSVRVPAGEGVLTIGWDAIAQTLSREEGAIIIECYPGVDERLVACELEFRLEPALVVETRNLLRPTQEIEELVKPFIGGSDPVFGFLCDLELPAFFDPAKVAQAQRAVMESQGRALVVGVGASLVYRPGGARGGSLVYADLARWEAQLRFRRDEAANLGAENQGEAWGQQYKRAFFVDWRVADRWKRPLISQWDFVLDTNNASSPKLAEGEAVRKGLNECAARPFRVVPLFDPAPWGGQWMKEVCDLDRSAANYGWCFDCVPEENSLFLDFGGAKLELPSIDLVFHQPQALLGEKVFARFGDEFPIRFDFLDTMGGGNLSFQVHPTNEYIKDAFGMPYTQDESYYLLDAGEDACVYLGLKEAIVPQEMTEALEKAQEGDAPFEADLFANRWPAKKHDHFLIPAGTVHCSGAESMVLEISATPYIFTFKLWDWGRLGLDGKPRPIYLEHGAKVIDWTRDTAWTRDNLINRVELVAEGPGWREERTGLHELEFIETRRHWFSVPVEHDTQGGVNVLNLVQGEEAVVESPTGSFEPFTVHYAETFIVPAQVGRYTIRPTGSEECATLKASVRT